MNDSTVTLAIVTFVLTQIGLALEARRRANRTDGKIDAVDAQTTIAATEAATAAKRAEPVSNGFAAKVLDGLEDITTKVSAMGVELHEVRKRVDNHIDDHASADVRRPGRQG